MVTTSSADPAGDAAALQLIERVGGSALVRKMVAAFLREAPRRIVSAEDALQRNDLSTVHAAMHSMKSSAAQLGAFKVHQLSTQIETSDDSAAIAGKIEQLRHELELYIAWLGDLAVPEAK
jgi:HPt (histidine-containing phosphotransfer) domain-containing protein